jgi:hypothetical protein
MDTVLRTEDHVDISRSEVLVEKQLFIGSVYSWSGQCSGGSEGKYCVVFEKMRVKVQVVARSECV